MTGRALLVPDCGAGVGLGHLERMLALADALRPGVDSALVLPAGDAALRDRVAARGHQAVELPGDAPARALAGAQRFSADAIVLDGYGFDTAMQATLRARAPVLVVDDLAHPCACDLAVNPAPAGETVRPPGAGAFLGGAAFALIPPAVVAARDRALAGGRAPRTVLVSSGGTDPGRLVARTAAELLSRDAGVLVTAVVGPEMRPDDLPSDKRLEVLLSPPSLAGALASATVYAGAAGTTALQAACVGLPAVVTAVADNQHAQAAALAAAGCAVVCEPGQLATTVLHLLDDAPRRRAMSAAGRQLVDGAGAARVADAVRGLARSAAPR